MYQGGGGGSTSLGNKPKENQFFFTVSLIKNIEWERFQVESLIYINCSLLLKGKPVCNHSIQLVHNQSGKKQRHPVHYIF